MIFAGIFFSITIQDPDLDPYLVWIWIRTDERSWIQIRIKRIRIRNTGITITFMSLLSSEQSASFATSEVTNMAGLVLAMYIRLSHVSWSGCNE